MQFIDLAKQQDLIRTELDEAIAQVLQHGRYIKGPEVAELERRLADFVGAAYCISCANGSDALQIALMACGVGPGDEVIVPAFSFVATASMVSLTGATPVFADVCGSTYNLDPDAVTKKITARTRAVIAVSLFGQCARLDELCAIGKQHGLTVIEDAAQSLGATHSGRASGSICDISCTSFFPSKPLGCYGDGGAIFTGNDALAARVRKIANHGQEKRYRHDELGMNSRLDTLQAAVLLCKLKVFEQEIAQRQEVAARYNRLLGAHLQIPVVEPGNQCVYAQYTVRVPFRDQVVSTLNDLGIPTAVHYPTTLPQQPMYGDDGDYPESVSAAQSVLSLPMHPYLEKEQQAHIAESLLSATAN